VLGTVDKAARVLGLFTPSTPEWGVTETAQALGVPRSSAHDLLSSLADTGLLQRAEAGRYRLGWKLLELGQTALTGAPLRTHARSVMRALGERLQATVHLAVLDDDEVVYLDKITSARVPVPVSAIGMRLAPHCSAVGKVLLAHQSRSVASRALERCGMAPLTERTSHSIDHLRTELEAIKTAGAAHDREGAVAGICCHAGPVFEHGRVVAAISVSVPATSDALAAEGYATAVRAASARISRSLGDRTTDAPTPAHALAA
jgi:IclR family KDG regulon transcriptional repressor